MGYPKGYIELSQTQDYPLLRQVLHSGFVTHQQLFEFMRLGYCERSRESFNWRINRLWQNRLVHRYQLPSFGRNFVYAIAPLGIAHLEGCGELCVGLPATNGLNGGEQRVFHAVEINDLHLALLRSGVLVAWTPEVAIRSRNELTSCGYVKDYDAIVTLRVSGIEVQLALEYERRPKAAKQYARIREAIEAERLANRFLYLFPNYHLLTLVSRFFVGSRRAIYFGLLGELKDQALAMLVLDSSGVRSFQLRAVLR